jgi:hypothetical protein
MLVNSCVHTSSIQDAPSKDPECPSDEGPKTKEKHYHPNETAQIFPFHLQKPRLGRLETLFSSPTLMILKGKMMSLGLPKRHENGGMVDININLTTKSLSPKKNNKNKTKISMLRYGESNPGLVGESDAS